jgi:hypothetical protein
VQDQKKRNIEEGGDMEIRERVGGARYLGGDT